MDIHKTLEQASEYGIAAISKAVEELKRLGQQAEQEEAAACQAYFSDVEERAAKVKQRVDDLVRQEEEIKQRISAMQPGLVNATVSGDTETFNRIQADLAGLEAQRAAIATQTQLLSSATLSGDLALYKAANDKAEACVKTRNQCKSDLEEIKRYVSDQIKEWEKIGNDLRYISFYTHSLHRRGREFSDVAAHFQNPSPLTGKEDCDE